MAQTNHELRSAVLLAAAHPNGMRSTDLPGYTTQAVYLAAHRLAAKGLLHTAPDGQRGVRYFADAGERDTWARANPPGAPAAAHVAITKAAPKRLTAGQVVGMDTAPRIVVPVPANARFCQPIERGALRAGRMPSDLPFVPRLGSTDHERHPSRTGDHLTWRDGRTARMGTTATTEG